MGQVLHGSAKTTHAIRAAIQRSKAPLKDLAARYGLNQKTVAKWRSAPSSMMFRLVPKPLVRLSCRQRKRRSLSPSASTRFCHWMTAFTPCRQRFLALLGRLCIDASNATASAGCRRSQARRPPRSRSNRIQLATSTSTSPRSAQRRARSKFAFAQLYEAASVKTAARVKGRDASDEFFYLTGPDMGVRQCRAGCDLSFYSAACPE
jgi:hypothetical protein